jgi:hypothetical protein
MEAGSGHEDLVFSLTLDYLCSLSGVPGNLGCQCCSYPGRPTCKENLHAYIRFHVSQCYLACDSKILESKAATLLCHVLPSGGLKTVARLGYDIAQIRA